MSLGVQANHAFSAGDVWKILSSSHPDGFSRLLKKIHDPEFLAMLNTDSPFPGLTLFECEYYQHRLRIIADTAYLAVCIPAACLMPSFAMKSTCAITAGILALAAFRSMRDMKQMSDALAVQEIDVPLPFPLNHIMTADAKMTAKINTVFKKAGERFDKVMEKIMPHERGAR
jgi:hypothetical protein